MTDQESTLVAFTSDLHYAVYTVAKDAGMAFEDVPSWFQALQSAVQGGLREAARERFDATATVAA